MSDDYGQPQYTYDRLTGATLQKGRVFHVVIRKWHSETGVERYETSKMHWPTEAEAVNAAKVIVEAMQKRIGAG